MTHLFDLLKIFEVKVEKGAIFPIQRECEWGLLPPLGRNFNNSSIRKMFWKLWTVYKNIISIFLNLTLLTCNRCREVKKFPSLFKIRCREFSANFEVLGAVKEHYGIHMYVPTGQNIDINIYVLKNLHILAKRRVTLHNIVIVFTYCLHTINNFKTNRHPRRCCSALFLVNDLDTFYHQGEISQKLMYQTHVTP